MGSTCGSARPEPGTVLVSLVPRNELLLAEVMIDYQDIGFVKPGQQVRLKLAAYPFQRYGMVDGVVKTVIADSQAQDIDQSEETKTESGVASTMIFKANIKLDQQALMVNKSPLPLAAGMQLSAEIVEGKRTVLQCLLSQVQRVVSDAGMEIDAVTKLISYSDKASRNGTSMRQPTTATMGSDEGMNTSIQKIPTDRRPGTRP